MTDVHKALYRFWSGFGVPAYLKGHVPDGTPFPYITFEVANGDTMRTSIITAFDWHRAASGVNVNAERAEIMDAIAEAIPAWTGCRVELEHGFLILRRNPADFQTYYDDPEDAAVIGGRTSVECTYYTM